MNRYLQPLARLSFLPFWVFASWIILAVSGCGNSSDAHADGSTSQPHVDLPVDTLLVAELDSFAHAPRVDGLFGLSVYDLTAQKPVYAINDSMAQSSASCIKLLTGMAALHLLGRNYEYTTTLYSSGMVADSTLHGDLALRADLDPQLQPADLQELASGLSQKGIRTISGLLYLDLTLQEPLKAEEHWLAADLQLHKYGLLYRGGEGVKQAMLEALQQQGIEVADSQVLFAKMPALTMLPVAVKKRPIRDVTRRMWLNSSNTQASSLLYTMGHHIAPGEDPAKAGVAYMRKYLDETFALRDTSLVIHDGSGLCHENKLSPRALIAFLRYGHQHPWLFNMLYEDLAISGEAGSLGKFMKGERTKGKIHAKTGTLSYPYGISNLAGYCYGANGHLLCFAIMNTQMSVLDAHVLQEHLCQILVEQPRKGQ